MNNHLIQFVLAGSSNNTESIIEIIIFFVFVLGVLLKNIFMAQKQQNQQKKRPVSNRPAQRTPVSSQRAKTQKDRVEQFLEGILQPKKIPQPHQPHPSKPVPQKTQQVIVPTGPKTDVPLPSQVSVSKPSVPAIPQVMTQTKSYMNAEKELGVSIMELPGIDTKLDKLEKMPEMKEEHVNENQHQLIYHKESTKTSQSKTTGILPAFSDTDDLKRAILYSEILGKPISMRQSQSIY